MKRFLFCMLLAPMSLLAQEVKLQEVTVSGARVVQQADRQVIYPTRQQLEASTSGYSLLQKLTLPHIRIDETTHSITALSASGGVEVRINDVKATTDDLLSLDMQAVTSIEFIDSPGLRYGEDVAYVINIIVRKPTAGYTVGADLTNALTTVSGSEMLFGKMNFGRSEVGLSYSLQYLRDRTDYRSDSHYLLQSGTVVDINRNSIDNRHTLLSNDLQLTYSLSDSLYVFQAKLNGQGDLRPERDRWLIDVNGAVVENNSSTRQQSPSLDLYYQQHLTKNQTLTANVVGTYIHSKADNENNEGTPYLYHTTGDTYTLWAEAIYENRLKPFTLSAGLQYGYRYSDNLYEGDASAHNVMRTNYSYGFSQLKGRIWKRLAYAAGFGISHWHYRQDAHHRRFLLLRPKLSLAYPLGQHWRVKYNFEISQHVSKIALISDVQIKQNAMETLVGNPDIRPNRVTSHDLRLTYTTPRLMNELQGYYRLNARCNMNKVIRQSGNEFPTVTTPFILTQTNARGCDFFFIQDFNRWTIIPDKLELTVYGGIYRYFNYGDDYTHTYTSFNGAAWLQAYLGRWTMMAYADNGYHWMEGEGRGHQGADWQLSASYSLSSELTAALYVRHPFCAHPLSNHSEKVNRYIQRDYVSHQPNDGNRLMLTLTWNLSHGRQYRDIQRTMNHRDTDTGILK